MAQSWQTCSAFARTAPLLGLAVLLGWPGSAPRAQEEDARALLGAAAQALGGGDRVMGVRNITLIGYGQYAYMFGGGNISADPAAPQKLEAANELRRIYDLEHGRFAQL